MSAKPSPRDRLEALALDLLDRLEANARAGNPPTVAELNGARRLVESFEAERRVADQLERANALTRKA